MEWDPNAEVVSIGPTVFVLGLCMDEWENGLDMASMEAALSKYLLNSLFSRGLVSGLSLIFFLYILFLFLQSLRPQDFPNFLSGKEWKKLNFLGTQGIPEPFLAVHLFPEPQPF
jgi:hypothetical protein